jgi:hypothetical protein
MKLPSRVGLAPAPAFRLFLINAARRLFVGACVGFYLAGMAWMLWRMK